MSAPFRSYRFCAAKLVGRSTWRANDAAKEHCHQRGVKGVGAGDRAGAARGGQIVNISSVDGYVGLPYNGAYAASKFALEGYSESLHLELLPFGISVSLVARMRRDGEASPVKPEDVARTVLRVVEAVRPKLRYPVGNLARSLPWLKTLLPQTLFERFMLRQFDVAA